MTGKRICCLWLPNLPVERWLGATGAEPESAVVLTVEAQHGQLIHAATEAALERGARVGGRLADARALDPSLQAVAADVAGDSAWLRQLASWAGRWSPLVEVDGDDGLRLDVTGVAHLFGGEERLLADMAKRVEALGFTSRAAIAPTAGAAWALARFGRGATTVDERRVAAALGPLPVAGLRLGSGPTATLVRLGLKTIGDLAGVPRKSLARRFRAADHPLDALDRALGRKAEPLTAAPEDPPPRALLPMKEPVLHPEAGTQALALLVPRLVIELERRKLGARELQLLGYRVDGSVARARVATSIPTREPAHLARLLADKAGALDPGFGFDAFALEASWWERLDAAQEALVGEPSGEAELARLVDRLSVKLGPGKVRRPAPRESHLPERANGWVAAVAASPVARPERRPETAGGGRTSANTPFDYASLPSGQAENSAEQGRPIRLLDAPEAIAVIYATPEGLPRRFVWRRRVHDIARAQGPERIAPEWWRERSTARLRDYYKVEDADGRRFWIFREGVVGDGRGGPPGWFVHGLFG